MLDEQQCLGLPRDGLMVVDCETTGLESDSRTIQFGAVFLDFDGNIEGTYWTYLRAEGLVGSAEAQSVHGITEDDLIGAPPFDKSVALMHPLFEARRVIAHRATFDWARLQHEFSLVGDMKLTDFYCSKTLCEHLGYGSLRLQEAARKFAIDPGKAHDAMDDALTVAHIIVRFLYEHPEETRAFLRIPQ